MISNLSNREFENEAMKTMPMFVIENSNKLKYVFKNRLRFYLKIAKKCKIRQKLQQAKLYGLKLLKSKENLFCRRAVRGFLYQLHHEFASWKKVTVVIQKLFISAVKSMTENRGRVE